MEKILFKGKTKKGSEIIIRYLQKTDLRNLLVYINKLSKEKTFITYQGEKITSACEKKYIDDCLKKIKNIEMVKLVVVSRKKIIGSANIGLKKKLIFKHVGTLGISIDKDFRGEGIGKILMEAVMKEAKNRLKNLKIIELQVFSNNLIAKRLYEKLGFKEFGMLPNGILHRGRFVGESYMYKKVK